jgi:hypothetical protein
VADLIETPPATDGDAAVFTLATGEKVRVSLIETGLGLYGYAVKVMAERTILVKPSSGNAIDIYTPRSAQAEDAENKRIVAERTRGVNPSAGWSSDQPEADGCWLWREGGKEHREVTLILSGGGSEVADAGENEPEGTPEDTEALGWGNAIKAARAALSACGVPPSAPAMPPRLLQSLARRNFRAPTDMDDLIAMAANIIAEDGFVIERLQAKLADGVDLPDGAKHG